MSWNVAFLPEAEKDILALARNQQVIVSKAIKKVRQNPLPQSESGYGKSLGHKHGLNLTNFLKIKLRGAGTRIVYKLVRTDKQMLVVVVGVRADEEVYEMASKRKLLYKL